ncbi:unnamed protein product [Echinostoma caproni]|uniref:40S ribosomal protein S15 n=1 Tax=Echinostoma caproni TaxID=27848 RepID=A0A183A1E1_9TREM|nr:unnamed protein product [Echinostoma caproni]
MAPPVLEPKEVEAALKQLDQKKAAGFDGLQPATVCPLLTLLQLRWLSFSTDPLPQQRRGPTAPQQKWCQLTESTLKSRQSTTLSANLV